MSSMSSLQYTGSHSCSDHDRTYNRCDKDNNHYGLILHLFVSEDVLRCQICDVLFWVSCCWLCFSCVVGEILLLLLFLYLFLFFCLLLDLILFFILCVIRILNSAIHLFNPPQLLINASLFLNLPILLLRLIPQPINLF